MKYTDILYTKTDHIARITINRPDVLNAFRSRTIDELIHAFEDAGEDAEIGVVVITGAGERAFCTGGDVKEFDAGGYSGASWTSIGMRVETLHRTIRFIPKPVIAAVNGYAIGGGNVLQVVCDLTIASENAVFGQVGPQVGSFDAGFGTAYLARLVGERKAREMWYLTRQYRAQDALHMGLINAVVPFSFLQDSVTQWASEILNNSPTSIKMIKASFNADSEHIAGIGQLAFGALQMFYNTEEAAEGHKAFKEKRETRYREYRRKPAAVKE